MKFSIDVTRVGFSVLVFNVEAKSVAEARTKGLQAAYDSIFNEFTYEYYTDDMDIPSKPDEQDPNSTAEKRTAPAVYCVEVERRAYRYAKIDIEAPDLASAKAQAIDEAGSHDFSSEKTSDYFVTSVLKKD